MSQVDEFSFCNVLHVNESPSSYVQMVSMLFGDPLFSVVAPHLPNPHLSLQLSATSGQHLTMGRAILRRFACLPYYFADVVDAFDAPLDSDVSQVAWRAAEFQFKCQ